MTVSSISTARRTDRGFTLIELMVTVAVVAILAAIAYPSYSAYITRARIPSALAQLVALQLRMEQRYQDAAQYSADLCSTTPAPTDFELRCTVDSSGQAFTVLAVGKGRLEGYEYSIDHNGTKRTTRHPRGAPSGTCWTIRGQTCEV